MYFDLMMLQVSSHHFLATAPSPGNLLQVNCYKHKKYIFFGLEHKSNI